MSDEAAKPEPPVFVIDGDDYPSPQVDSFDMAERRVMFDLCGVVQEDFVRYEGETDEELVGRLYAMTRHPGFVEALMHIAYQRANPDMKRAKVQAVIDRTNYKEAVSKWVDREDDELPPAQEPTSELNGSSPTDSIGSSEISGGGSTTVSDLPGNDLASIGIPRSDSPVAAPSARSAA